MRVLHPRRRQLPFAIFSGDPSSIMRRRLREGVGFLLVGSAAAAALALATWSVGDPSFSHATRQPAHNLLGAPGATVADLLMQLVGLASIPLVLVIGTWGWRLVGHHVLDRPRLRALLWFGGSLLAAGGAAGLPRTAAWPLPSGLGGALGDLILSALRMLPGPPWLDLPWIAAPVLGIAGLLALFVASGAGLHRREEALDEPAERTEERGGRVMWLGLLTHWALSMPALARRLWKGVRGTPALHLPTPLGEVLRRADRSSAEDWTAPVGSEPLPESFADADGLLAPDLIIAAEPASPFRPLRSGKRRAPPSAAADDLAPPQQAGAGSYALPSQGLLSEPKKAAGVTVSADALEQNARALEGVLDDFGVRGQIINVRPGPVVTLYELEPAPGIKSSRVIGLADDIARSMSAISARVAVVPGRNVIGIELPNPRRETVFLRELLAAENFSRPGLRLPLCLGKNIGGEPIIAELARMPHLLIAGTTGSGKSVAINTMILSLLYRLTPQECRLIMIDPKMLELSVYDGIPHLLSPVVTDPKKAVVALKWAVREMEDRYRKMSKLGVRNIDGFNARVAQSADKGEAVTRTVQTGFDKRTGEAIYEQEVMDLQHMPYVVVIVDEMADLMLVAGKEIEGTIQRLAQMARAAGIHIVMATQRPSVDVITGTIKANFPTRISFQVTSKIDSRTILSEMGAEQLLGQGDMLYMAGGGRISRVHGPFVTDEEVERVVAYLKTQGSPDYLDAVTVEAEDPAEGGADGAVFDKGSFGEEGGELYEQALAVVLRDKKCSTSYIQRRLQIGYNRAASLVERMEKEGVVGAANHAGKREILLETQDAGEV